MRTFVAVFAACVPLEVIAQQTQPSFDCSAASSEAEIAICNDPELAASDRVLAETYGAALEAAGALDAGSDAALAELRATQRGWIGGRDECWKADNLSACIADAVAQRTGELTALWMLSEPYAEAFYNCGEDGRFEVYAAFFDTPGAALRIEYGDRILAMTPTRTASGARYDGLFGAFFWERDGEATFAPEEGTEVACRVRAG